jgi:hypothetical protein
MEITMRQFIVLLFFFSSTFHFAQDYTAMSPFIVTINSDIRTFSDNKSVIISANVTNKSDTMQEFKRYEVKYTTFQPVVYDMTGREAETTVAYRIDGNTASVMTKGASKRTIQLAPNETFSIQLNLADFYELVPGRKYRVRLLFLPDAAKTEAIKGNNQYVFIIDEKSVQANQNIAAEETGDSTAIRPGEVIQLFLTAEMKENWNDYLKFIDEEQYIFSYPQFAGRYVGSNDSTQNSVLMDFKAYLIQYRPDVLLEYSVLEETISGDSAQVKVRAYRQAARNPFVYVYTFSLEKYSSYWRITGVEATLSRDVRQ